MRRRFFWSIFGVAALTSVLLIAAAIGSLNTVRERATRTELERAAVAVAEGLSTRLTDGRVVGALIQGGNLEEFGIDIAALRRAAGGSDLAFFAIGQGGQVIGRAPVRDLPLDTEALLRGETDTLDVSTEDGSVIAVAAPSGVSTQRDVTVGVILYRAAPLALELPTALVVIVLVVVAVVAAVLARFLSSGLTRRLRSVADASEALSKGDLEARAEVGGTDEVHTVAESFNRMAEQLGASRERERQFLLAVGHDLRTPLTTITGYAEALEDRVEDQSEIRRIAGVMSVEVGRLRRLIEDVMLLARLESAEFSLRPEPVDVAAHVGGMVDILADRGREVGVEVVADLEQTGLRDVDPDRVGQILGNLGDNALRYTPEMGRIVVGLRADASDLVLTVTDSGPGIEGEDLAHIFDRFYVARKYRGVRPEGSGLGLSIVNVLTQAMGGSVTASSDGSTGTIFEVRFPAPPAGVRATAP